MSICDTIGCKDDAEKSVEYRQNGRPYEHEYCKPCYRAFDQGRNVSRFTRVKSRTIPVRTKGGSA